MATIKPYTGIFEKDELAAFIAENFIWSEQARS
jgi:hypothetical protein